MSDYFSDFYLSDENQKENEDSGYFSDFYTEADPSVDVGPQIDEEGGFGSALWGGVKSTANRVGSTADLIQGDKPELIQGAIDARAIEVTGEQSKFRKNIEELKDISDDSIWQGVKNVASAAWENPVGAAHEIVGQIPNSGVVMAGMFAGAKAGGAAGTLVAPGPGTVIGTIGGGIIGMFAGNFAVEAGGIAQEKAADGHLSDEEMDKALGQAAIKSGVITGVDTLTMGVNRLVLGAPGRAVEGAITKTLIGEGVDVSSDSAVRAAMLNSGIKQKTIEASASAFESATGLKPRAGMGATAFLTETLGEGTGEYLGSKAAGLDTSFTEAAMESLMSIPQSAGDMYVAKRLGTEGRVTGIVNSAINKKSAKDDIVSDVSKSYEEIIGDTSLDSLDDLDLVDMSGGATQSDLDIDAMEPIDIPAGGLMDGIPLSDDPSLDGQLPPASNIENQQDIEQGYSQQSRIQEQVDSAYAQRDEQSAPLPAMPSDAEYQIDGATSQLTPTNIAQGLGLSEKSQQLRQNIDDANTRSEIQKLEDHLQQQKIARAEEDKVKIAALKAETPANTAMLDALANANSMAPDDLKNKIISDEKARQEAIALRARREAASRSQKAQSRRKVNPEKDELLTAIAKLGGLSPSDTEGAQKDYRSDFKRGGFQVFYMTEGKGHSFDAMSEKLAELGYLRADSNGKVDAHILRNMVDKSLSGEWNGTDDGLIYRATKQLEEDMLGSDGQEAEAMLDELAVRGDDAEGVTSAESVLTDSIIEAIDAGVDPMLIAQIGSDDAGKIVSDLNQLIEANNESELGESQGQRNPPAEAQRAAAEEDEFLEGVITTAGAATDQELDDLFGPSTLSAYTEDDLRAIAETDTDKAEAKAQVDAEADFFDLGQNDDSNISISASNDALQQSQGSDLFSQPSADEITAKASQAATSPENNRAEPTDAQKEAGNYKKGEPFTLHGQKIVIENPKGSERSGKDADGKAWSNTMAAHYGDIKGTIAADGDALDVFVGPNPKSQRVWIIDQVTGANKAFDEHKIMMGFNSESEAEKAYRDSYDESWDGIGSMLELSVKELNNWIESGDTKAPYGNIESSNDQANINAEAKPSPRPETRTKKEEPSPRPETRTTKLDKAESAIDAEIDIVAAELAELLKPKPGTLNSGIDPQVLIVGSKLGALYVSKGVVKFAQWSKAIINKLRELGVDPEQLTPHLKEIYAATQQKVSDDEFDLMDDARAVRKMDIEKILSEDNNSYGKADLSEFLFNRLDQLGDNRKLKAAIGEYNGVDAKAVDDKMLKVAQEAMEIALVRQARNTVRLSGQNEKAVYDKLVEQYLAQPNLNVRSSTSIENQAYSTPAPIAFLSSQLAGIDVDSKVYEPTAGNGMLLIGASIDNSTTNELNDSRAENLRKLGYNPTQNDATTYTPGKESFDSVIMNPPFGSLDKAVKLDGFGIKKIDHLIAGKALEAMKDNGRAVLIIGANKDAGVIGNGADKVFFNWLYSHYNVADHFEVNGDLYKRQGAAWPIRVITVNGRVESDTMSPKSGSIIRLDNWKEIYDHYNEVMDTIGQQSKPAGKSSVVSKDSAEQQVGAERLDAGQAANTNGQGKSGGNKRSAKPGAGYVEPSVDGRQPDGNIGNTDSRGDAIGVDQRSGTKAQQEAAADNGADTAGEINSDIARTDGVASSGKRRVGGGASEFQSSYKATSGGNNDNVLTPKNMAEPTEKAFAKMVDDVGNLDAYVMTKLGYNSKEELYKAFMGLQVDTIAAAIYNIEVRGKGIIIADQTGVGKGRQAAGMIRYAMATGRTPIFVTVKANLFTDMYEDLIDIGSHDVKPFITGHAESISSNDRKLFKNSAKINKAKTQSIINTGQLPADSNVLFTTYDQIKGAKNNPRRDAITSLVESGKALFVLDESHNAAGEFVKDGKDEAGNKIEILAMAGFISQSLENADAVYLSATFAKTAKNMPVYHRTDLLEAVDSPAELIDALTRGGVPIQQVVSAMLAENGQLFRRERSFEGINIPIVVDRANVDYQERVSDAVNEGLRAVVSANNSFIDIFMEEYAGQLELPGGSVSLAGNQAGKVNAHPFTSVAHNYIRMLLLGLKAQTAAESAIELHEKGVKPVIALENTLGSMLEDYIDRNNLSEGDPINFNYNDILLVALERSRRVSVKDAKGDSKPMQVELHQLDPLTEGEYLRAAEVIKGIDLSGLPSSPIDFMLEKMKAAGMSVDEITGRKWRIDYSGSQPVVRAIKKKTASDRRAMIDGFNDGNTNALILNVAGSTGLSIHASEKFKDQSPRHMIVAQAMLDINILMQMLGRINRTGQVEYPQYSLMSLDIPAEKRPMANTAGKLAKLNANTSANDKSDNSFDAPDFLNKYGDEVANDWLKDNPDIASATRMTVSDSAPAEGFANKFTGRLALLDVKIQREVYDELLAAYEAKIKFLDSIGQNDLVAQTLPIDAYILESKVIHEGKDKSNPFTGDTTLHKINAKYIGKPPVPQEVNKEINASLGKLSADEFAQNMIDKADQDKTVMSSLDDSAKEAAKALSKAAEKAQSYKGSDEKIATKLSNEVARLNAEIETINERIGKFTESKKEHAALINQYKVGSFFRLDLGDEIVTAVVSGVKSTHKKGRGSPYALSKTAVTFMVNTGSRSASLPLSKLKADGDYFDRAMTGRGEEMINKTFDPIYATSDKRETRYIATGNIIAGMGKLEGGRIVMFNDRQGNEHQGIMMPRKYGKKGEFENGDATSIFSARDPKAATKYMTGGDIPSQVGMFTRDKSIRLRSVDGSLMITLPSSGKDAVAKSVKLNKELRDIIGDFYSRGKTATAKIPQGKELAAIEALLNITPLSAPNKFRDSYVAAGGEAQAEAVMSFDGKTMQSTDNAPAEAVEMPESEDTPSTEVSAVAPSNDLTEYITKKGKSIMGYVRPDLTLDQAKEIDPYSWMMKDKGGPFIREKHFDLLNEKFPLPSSDVVFSRSARESIGNNRPSGSITKNDAASVVRGIIDGWDGAASRYNEAVIVDTFKELPQAIKDEAKRQDAENKIDGVFHDGKLYVVADKLKTAEDVERVVFHEAYGHYGLKLMFGKSLTAEMNQLFVAIGGVRGLNTIAKKNNINLTGYAKGLQQAVNKGKLSKDQRNSIMMEELLAHIQQDTRPGVIKKVKALVGALRNWMRSKGWVRMPNLGETDLLHLLSKSKEAVIKGKADGTGTGIRFIIGSDKNSYTDSSTKRAESNEQKTGSTQGQPSREEGRSNTDPYSQFYEEQAEADEQTATSGSGEIDRPGRQVTPSTKLYRRSYNGKPKFNNARLSTGNTGTPTARLGHFLATADPGNADRYGSYLTEHSLDFKKPINISSFEFYELGSLSDAGIDSFRKDLILSGHDAIIIDMDEQGTWVVALDGDKVKAYEAPMFSQDEKLPMDKASRMARAEAMGFDTSTIYYHGTNAVFNEFKDGSAPGWGQGIYLTDNKQAASSFGENVNPFYIKLKHPYRETPIWDEIETSNKWAEHPLNANGEGDPYDAWQEDSGFVGDVLRELGYDGIIAQGSNGINGLEVVVFDPSSIRSIDAAFAPSEADSKSVMFSRQDGQGDESLADILGEDGIEQDALEKLGLNRRETEGISGTIKKLMNTNFRETWDDATSRAYEGVFDGLVGIKDAEAAVGIDPSDFENSGYVGARMATGIADVMHAILHYGAPEWGGGVIQHREGTEGLLTIFGELGEDLTDWLGWMGGMRGAELMEQGRENNLTSDDIAQLQSLIEGREEKFMAAHEKYRAMNTAMLDLSEQAGMVDPESRAQWESDYYVPFYRQDETEGGVKLLAPRSSRGLSHQTNGIKALKGGQTATNDLLENILTNWLKLADSAMKNSALVKTIENLGDSDFVSDESMHWTSVSVPKSEVKKRIKADRNYQRFWANTLGMSDTATDLEVINEIAKIDSEGYDQMWSQVAPTDPDVIRIKVNGKSKYYRVHDPKLLRAVTHLGNEGNDGAIIRGGRWFKRLLTTGVTASPDFIVRNFVRDAAHAWAINPDGFKFGKDSLTGMKKAFEEDADYRELMFSGASFQGGYIHGTDPEAGAQMIRRALAAKGLSQEAIDGHLDTVVDSPKKLWTMTKQGWQAYRTFGDKIENANRLATFKAAKASGKSLAQAVYESKDLMDYSLRGNWAAMNVLTDVVPFLNARLQGLSKLARAGKEHPKEIGLALAKIAMASVALAAWNDDDERYQQLPDWEKDMYWHFWIDGGHWRLPKPFEIGIIAGTMPERIYHAWIKDSQPDDKVLFAMKHGMLDTLGFEAIPQAVLPLIEVWGNKSRHFDSPIESMSDRNKLPQDRYNARTSDSMVVIGDVLGLSPKQLEHLWKGYTGTMGAYALSAVDILVGWNKPSRGETQPTDIPLVKSFYRGDGPAYSTQYMTDIYDRLSEVNQIAGSLRDMRGEARQKFIDENKPKLQRRKLLTATSKTLRGLRKRRDIIMESTTMTDKEKQLKLDLIQRRMNEVSKRGSERTEDAF